MSNRSRNRNQQNNSRAQRFDQDGDGDFDFWDVILLVVGLVIAGGLWYASMVWSVNGFEITTAGDNAWIGWLLGFTITYLEIIFNRGSQNKTLWLFGLASYGYGFATNLVGIIGSRTAPVVTGNWLDTILNIAVIIFLASIVEWVPEHLVVRLLRPGKKESDFVSEFVQGVRDISARNWQPKSGNTPHSHQNNNQRQQQPQNRQRGQGQPQNQRRNNSQPMRDPHYRNSGDNMDRLPIPNIDDLIEGR